MTHALIIEAEREGYSIDQCHRTMTVAQLKEALEFFDDDMPIYFSHDNGYTYGSLKAENIDERFIKSDDEIFEEE